VWGAQIPTIPPLIARLVSAWDSLSLIRDRSEYPMVTLGDNHVTDTADILLICVYSLRVEWTDAQPLSFV